MVKSKSRSFVNTGNLWKWFRGNLSSRMQCKSLHFRPVTLVSVVPQGSILGPLLLIFPYYFVNDFSMSSILLFTDDTKYLLPVKTFSGRLSLQRDLYNLSLGSLNWKLNFNESK